jgi:hypothetical protein
MNIAGGTRQEYMGWSDCNPYANLSPNICGIELAGGKFVCKKYTRQKYTGVD